MNQIEQGITNDMPDHQSGSESSIGGLGDPCPSSFHRLKGFYEQLVNTPERVGELSRQFNAGLHRLTDSGEFTRLQHRAIFEGEMLREVSSVVYPYVEAVVPLDPGHLGREPILVYLAANTKSRNQREDDVINLSINVALANNARDSMAREAIERASRRGYQIAVLSVPERESESVRDQVSRLYERFGWSRPDVVRMLQNPNNILSVARHNGQIVSSGIAEMAIVPIEGHPFRIAELTEAATLSEHERNGCFSAISKTLLLELRRRSQIHEIYGGELDLVFGESNGLSEGILQIAARQGRTFSTDTTPQFGFPRGGILRQQVPISGPFRRTEYNDLVVTSLTRSQLYRRY